MCDPTGGIATLAAVGIAGGVMSASENAKAQGQQTDNERKQQNQVVKQANWAENDQKLAQHDKWDEAQRHLTEVNLQAIRNQGTINTAVGESGLAGNSMDRLKNSVANDASAQKMNITDAYERDYQAIFANRVGSVENARDAVKGLGGNKRKVNNIANALNIISGGAGGYAQGQQISTATAAKNTKTS